MKSKENKEELKIREERRSRILERKAYITSKSRKLGRNVVYTLLAASWALSFSKDGFQRIPLILWSLGLAILYVFLDLLYYFIAAIYFKILQYLNNNKSFPAATLVKIERGWSIYFVIWNFILVLLLMTSALLIVVYIFTFKNT